MASSPEDTTSQGVELVDTDVIAGSSDATETHAEPSMLDAVQAALDAEDTEEAATSKPGETEGELKPAVEGEVKAKDDSELSELDLSRLSLKAQKRIRGLVKDLGKADTKAAEFEPKAKAYDTITTQIRETGLDQNDLSVTFDIATALKRGDAFRARQLMAPIWEAVNNATGGVLPDDLAAEVQGQKLSYSRAQEIAVARAAAAQTARQGQVHRERQEATNAQQLRDGAVNSVNDWERTKSASDPDWKLKAPEIMRSIKLSLLEGNKPKSPAEAVAMAERALADVNERFRTYRPAPRAVRAVVSGGGASRSNSDPAPKSMMDVINASL